MHPDPKSFEVLAKELARTDLQVQALVVLEIPDPRVMALDEGLLLLESTLLLTGGDLAGLMSPNVLGNVVVPEGADLRELVVIVEVELLTHLGLHEGQRLLAIAVLGYQSLNLSSAESGKLSEDALLKVHTLPLQSLHQLHLVLGVGRPYA